MIEERTEMQIVGYEERGNGGRELIETTIEQPVKDNWVVSKDEYISHLTK